MMAWVGVNLNEMLVILLIKSLKNCHRFNLYKFIEHLSGYDCNYDIIYSYYMFTLLRFLLFIRKT